VFKSSADGFCGCQIKKWHHPCEAVKAGQTCPGKSKRVIFKECCCSEECCRETRQSIISERDDADIAFLSLKGELLGQIEVYELNEAAGLKLPGGDLPAADHHTKLDDLGSRYDHPKWLADEHAKCEMKRKALQTDEFEDPETLSDAATSSDSDL
jgi:hypothetical protein